MAKERKKTIMKKNTHKCLNKLKINKSREIKEMLERNKKRNKRKK